MKISLAFCGKGKRDKVYTQVTSRKQRLVIKAAFMATVSSPHSVLCSLSSLVFITVDYVHVFYVYGQILSEHRRRKVREKRGDNLCMHGYIL